MFCAGSDYEKKYLFHLKSQRRGGSVQSFPLQERVRCGEASPEKVQDATLYNYFQGTINSNHQGSGLYFAHHPPCFTCSVAYFFSLPAYLLSPSSCSTGIDWLASCTSFCPFPPSGHASQAPMPVTLHPIHGLWHCFHLIFCHLLLYLLFQFCLTLLGSSPHLHHCLLSFCPLFLLIISSLSLAASSPHCFSYCLISPCTALFLPVCPYLIPFSASPFNTAPSHFTASCAVFLSHCHIPIWSHSFGLLFATHLQHFSACLCFPFS